MRDRELQIRCYGELNDCLAPDKRHTTFSYPCSRNPTIEGIAAELGLPPGEIDLALVNGSPAGFEQSLRPGDRLALYPVFESLDISGAPPFQGRPLRRSRFVADVHLGKLARLLRMLGFDTLWRRDCTDAEILAVAGEGGRILLTRDQALLKSPGVQRGIRVVSQQPHEQIAEVLERLDLASQFRPFSRCMVCNGMLAKVDKARVLDRLPPRTRERHEDFRVCVDCQRIYWAGSHYGDMVSLLRRLAPAGDGVAASRGADAG